MPLTHPDRIYWPDEGVTKEGLANYYAQVWHLMAPYVVNRPLALLRLPDGISGHQRFFQKHAWKGMNDHIEEITDPKDKGGESCCALPISTVSWRWCNLPRWKSIPGARRRIIGKNPI